MKKTLLLGILLLHGFTLSALSYNFGIKYFGINIHPIGDRNAELFPIKLGSNGFLVPSFGAMLSFDLYVWRDIFFVRLAMANYTDCTQQFAGFAHLGPRVRIFSIGRHELNGGIGPTFIFRKNWYKLDGYDDTQNFYGGNKDDDYQMRFIVYGGELEYDYRLKDNIDFSVTFVPGIPILMSFAFGVRIRK
jgi:hypothetical protein